MGTPSDKKSISKVVPELQIQPISPDDLETSLDLQENTTTEMTILRNIPSLGIYMEPDLEPTATKDIFVDTGQNVNLETLDALEKELLITSKLVKEDKEDKPIEELGVAGPSGLQETSSKIKKSDVKKYVCSVCSKSFSNSTKLINHQNIHGESTPFKCEECKKSFSSKFKLVRHVLIHSDCKPFNCTVCERTFHRKDHLKNHIKVHSPSKKVFICEKTNCRKEYTSIMSYRKHLALHSAEEGSLQCKICSKTFETKAEILYHLKIHAGSRTVKNPNEKKFTCDHCDRKFFTRKDVRRHLVVHTGTRNFLCQFCPQRFGRKDHLVRHIKKSHSTNINESDINYDLYETKKESEPQSDSKVLSFPQKPDFEVDVPGSHFLLESSDSKTPNFGTNLLGSEKSALSSQESFPNVETVYSERPQSEFSEGVLILKEKAFAALQSDVCVDKSDITTNASEIQTYEGIISSESDIKLERLQKGDFEMSVNILSSESVMHYPESQIKLDDSQKDLSVENMLFPQTFSELSPMLCSDTENLQYLPHETNPLFKTTNLQSETELLTELVVMKEELEQRLSTQSTNVDLLSTHDIDLNNSQLMSTDMIDSDILRLISDSGDLSTTEDENNLPLPGFSQAFQQPP